MSVPFTRANVYMLYGFETNNLTDPAQIAQRAVEEGKLMKCPVLAEDASLAVALFSEKYPDLMPGGVVNLAELRAELDTLEEFYNEQVREFQRSQGQGGDQQA